VWSRNKTYSYIDVYYFPKFLINRVEYKGKKKIKSRLLKKKRKKLNKKKKRIKNPPPAQLEEGENFFNFLFGGWAPLAIIPAKLDPGGNLCKQQVPPTLFYILLH
jgi:hypothetical protein